MNSRRGITLLEMVIVAGLAALAASLAFPALTSGLDQFRLIQSSDTLAALLGGGINRAERLQEPVQVAIIPKERTILLRSPSPGFHRKLELPDGVKIKAVLPLIPGAEEEPRSILLMPGSNFPKAAIVLENARGARRKVSLSPLTGVPLVERLDPDAKLDDSKLDDASSQKSL